MRFICTSDSGSMLKLLVVSDIIVNVELHDGFAVNLLASKSHRDVTIDPISPNKLSA